MQTLQPETEKFYGLDGDGIGKVVEACIIRDKIEDLSIFSKKVSLALDKINKAVDEKGGTIIFCAGDSILFRGYFSDSWCEKILDLFSSLTERTASLGIGNTATEAFLALKLAKATGGGKIMHLPWPSAMC